MTSLSVIKITTSLFTLRSSLTENCCLLYNIIFKCNDTDVTAILGDFLVLINFMMERKHSYTAFFITYATSLASASQFSFSLSLIASGLGLNLSLTDYSLASLTSLVS